MGSMIGPYHHVGFSGSRRGMTDAQQATVTGLLGNWVEDPPWFHHGDCVGSDEQAHNIALRAGYSVHLHPPDNPAARAFCQHAAAREEPRPYMVRNTDIAVAADVLVAAPGERTEQLRSGTWSTVRRARRLGKPVVVVMPDGTVEWFNEGG